MKATIIITCVFLLCASVSRAQETEAAALLQQVKAHYLEMPRFEAALRVDYFINHRAQKPVETQPMLIRKQQDMFYKRYMGLEELRNRDFFISVYHTREIIRLERAAEHPLETLLGLEFDSYFEASDSIAVSQPDAGHKEIVFYLDDETVSRIVLSVNTRSKTIDKQTVYYAEPFVNSAYNSTEHPHMEITLERLDENAPFGEDEFTGEQYFTQVDGKRTVSPKLRNYAIINNIPPSKP